MRNMFAIRHSAPLVIVLTPFIGFSVPCVLSESQQLFPAKQFPSDVRPEFLEDVIQDS